MDSQVQILNEAACLLSSINTLGKSMNPAILTPARVDQTRLFNLDIMTNLGEGKV